MKRSGSSSRWLADHEDDEYVRKARRQGYRSRASYKLLEMDDRYRLLKKGICVVDLGAAPGGWSQVAAARVGENGKVIAVDRIDMPGIAGVRFIHGDFESEQTLQTLLQEMGDGGADLVISDMAPNLIGVSAIDQPRSALLAELALELADRILRRNGNLVVKCFEGEGIGTIRASFRERFERVNNCKPKASRQKSREVYVIGQGFRGTG